MVIVVVGVAVESVDFVIVAVGFGEGVDFGVVVESIDFVVVVVVVKRVYFDVFLYVINRGV